MLPQDTDKTGLDRLEDALEDSTALDAEMQAIADQLERLEEEEKQREAERLQALTAVLVQYRDEAIKARSESGIEDCWARDQDAYDGIDDGNRNEARIAGRKPLAGGGTAIASRDRGRSIRSTLLPNITQQFTDIIAARMSDMTMPQNDRGYELQPTPIADIPPHRRKIIADRMFQRAQQAAAEAAEQYNAAMQQQQAQGPSANPPPPPPPDPSTIKPPSDEDVQMQVQKVAKERAAKAQVQIDDWLAEGLWHGKVREVIRDCMRLGTGILGGPLPCYRKVSMADMDEETGEIILTAEDKLVPDSRRVDPWNFWPDPACGEDLQSGQYAFELDTISAKTLIKLKGKPGYLDDQIDAVLEQGPQNVIDAAIRGRQSWTMQQHTGNKRTMQYEMWFFTGWLSDKDLLALNCDCEAMDEYRKRNEGAQMFPAQVTLVNDTVIHANLAPLDKGELPYDVIVWKRRSGMLWGEGIPSLISVPARIVTAATRAMMDNAGFASMPMIFVDRTVFDPDNGTMELAPGKMFALRSPEGGIPVNAQQAIQFVQPPSTQAQQMAIIMWALEMAERIIGLPVLLQGQMSASPETLGGMVMLQNNAGATLRDFARRFDTCITLPHIRRYYAYLMQYGEDSSMKGDYNVVARGSTTLVERDLANQALIQMAQLTANPAFGFDSYKFARELCKAQRIDPDSVQIPYNEYERRMQAQSQQPAGDPDKKLEAQTRIELEKLKLKAAAESDQRRAEAEQALLQQKLQADMQARENDAKFDQQSLLMQAQMKNAEIQARIAIQNSLSEVELAKLAAQSQVSMEQLRTRMGIAKLQIDSKNAQFNAEAAMKTTLGTGI